MFRKLAFAVSFAAGYAIGAGVVAGAGKQPSAQLEAQVRRSSRPPGVQQWAGSLSSAASTVADSTRSAFRQTVATVSARRDTHDAASAGAPTTSGGVIPLGAVPIDQLSEWELDLLTTPDSSH